MTRRWVVVVFVLVGLLVALVWLLSSPRGLFLVSFMASPMGLILGPILAGLAFCVLVLGVVLGLGVAVGLRRPRSAP